MPILLSSNTKTSYCALFSQEANYKLCKIYKFLIFFVYKSLLALDLALLFTILVLNRGI